MKPGKADIVVKFENGGFEGIYFSKVIFTCRSKGVDEVAAALIVSIAIWIGLTDGGGSEHSWKYKVNFYFSGVSLC
jgi:hypothetical protein